MAFHNFKKNHRTNIYNFREHNFKEETRTDTQTKQMYNMTSREHLPFFIFSNLTLIETDTGRNVHVYYQRFIITCKYHQQFLF